MTDRKQLAKDLAERKLPADLPELLVAAQNGDKRAVARVRKEAEKLPTLWDCLSPSITRDDPLIEAAAAGNELGAECLQREMDKVRHDLAPDSAPKLERMIAHQIARCWLHLRYLETWQAQTGAKDWTLPQRDQLERLVSRAEGRYLRALRTLALVRRLPVAPVKVAVDARQVHLPPGAIPSHNAQGEIGQLQAPVTTRKASGHGR